MLHALSILPFLGREVICVLLLFWWDGKSNGSMQWFLQWHARLPNRSTVLFLLRHAANNLCYFASSFSSVSDDVICLRLLGVRVWETLCFVVFGVQWKCANVHWDKSCSALQHRLSRWKSCQLNANWFTIPCVIDLSKKNHCRLILCFDRSQSQHSLFSEKREWPAWQSFPQEYIGAKTFHEI